MEFLTGEKENQRSNEEKPTATSGVSIFGKSCIMHSRRVGFLKSHLSASLYFGLTNSSTTPMSSPFNVWT